MRAITLTMLADDFAGRAAQTERAAEGLLDSPVLVVGTVLGLTGVLALGFWLVKGSLDAMRLGLLTRFMGVLGIALGPALVLGFGLLVMPLWLFALGIMFAGYWPRGVPPAWIPAAPSRGRAREAPPASPPRRPRSAAPARNGEVDAVGPGVHKPGSEPGRRPVGAGLAAALAMRGARAARGGAAGLGVLRGVEDRRRQGGVRDPARPRAPRRARDRVGELPRGRGGEARRPFRCLAVASNGDRARCSSRSATMKARSPGGSSHR